MSSQVIRLVKHNPLIKFPGRRPKIIYDPTKIRPIDTRGSMKDTPTNMPLRWRRKPLSQQEIDIIMSGGVQN